MTQNIKEKIVGRYGRHNKIYYHLEEDGRLLVEYNDDSHTIEDFTKIIASEALSDYEKEIKREEHQRLVKHELWFYEELVKVLLHSPHFWEVIVKKVRHADSIGEITSASNSK